MTLLSVDLSQLNSSQMATKELGFDFLGTENSHKDSKE